jgi:endoribonuclease Dicer
MGAILVDSGYDIDICRDIYNDNILPYMDKYCHGPHEESRNPKDMLHKIMAQRKCQHFSIRRDNLNSETNDFDAAGKSYKYILDISNRPVIIHDTEVGKGRGPWQEMAVRRACTEVMGKIKGDMNWLEGICGCRPKI